MSCSQSIGKAACASRVKPPADGAAMRAVADAAQNTAGDKLSTAESALANTQANGVARMKVHATQAAAPGSVTHRERCRRQGAHARRARFTRAVPAALID